MLLIGCCSFRYSIITNILLIFVFQGIQVQVLSMEFILLLPKVLIILLNNIMDILLLSNIMVGDLQDPTLILELFINKLWRIELQSV